MCVAYPANVARSATEQSNTRASNRSFLACSRLQPQEDSCLSAISMSPFAKALALNGIQEHIDQSWIAHAEQALRDNTLTLALLPMDQLFKPDGYLSVLQWRDTPCRPPPSPT
jgi:hypothetical protein